MRLYKISSEFITLNCFLILFIPSIKFFFFSSMVNIILVGTLMVFTLMNLKKIKVKQFDVTLLLIFNAFICTQLFSGFWYDTSVNMQELFKYISILMIINCVILCFDIININRLHTYMISWTVFLSILYLLNVIEPSGAGELSYLVLSMQLGIGFCAAITIALIQSKINIIYLIIAIFLLLIMSTLAGRTALFLSVFISLITMLIYAKINIVRRFYTVIIFLVIIFLTLIISWPYISEHLLNEYFLYKMDRMVSSGDGRFDVYLRSIDIILNNILGLGLQKYNTVIGFYPHNIFLEVMLNAGFISVLLLLIFIMIWSKLVICSFYRANHDSTYIVSLGMIALFLFISWNTSNNLTSSYVPFTALILSMKIIKSKTAIAE